MLIATIARILLLVLNIYMWVLFARMVLSWLPLIVPGWRPRGAILVIFEAIYTVTDPPLNFVRRFVRPLRVGTIGLDLAFMVVILIIIILQRILWIFS